MQLYYHPDLSNSVFDLTEEESIHLKVLRLQMDTQIHVTDGKGRLAIASIIQNKRRQWTVSVIEQNNVPPVNISIELAISPLKNNERIEWLLEKATEMGVGKFVIVPCTRTERKSVNEERLRKVIISAAKQSQHVHFPELVIASSYAKYVNEQTPIHKLIAYCGENTVAVNDILKTGQSVRILIGPEGDFTDEEITLALEGGYTPVRLGESRLRSETAGLYTVALFKFLNRA